MISDELKKDWLEMFAGGPERREAMYRFFEQPKTRAYFQGAEGVARYAEVIEIASKAGAPLEEVRGRLMPLVDQEELKAYAEKAIKGFINSGSFEKTLDDLATRKEKELQAKKERLTEGLSAYA